MQLLALDQHDNVLVVKLNRGITNALSLEMVTGLIEILQSARANPAVHAVILSSANDKFFSIGFDIPALFPLDRDDFFTFYRSFNQLSLELYTFPKPTIAALTGHAIAGGCIVALCCDYRLIAEGKKLMGLNEVKLGVPVPYPADCILQALIGSRQARDIMESGEFYSPEQSLSLGLVDQVLPLEQVLASAFEHASQLGSTPAGGRALIKRNRVEAVEARILAQLEHKESAFLDCWFSAAAREQLQVAAEKF